MNEWMHAWCKVLCKCNSETLNTQYFQQRSISIDSKGYRTPILEIKYATWTYDPKSDPKRKPYKSARLIPHATFVFAAQPSHASPFPEVHLRFRLWPLCSPLSVVIYSFCSLSICSRFRINSWSTIFSFFPFGSHDCSFDPSVVDEEPTLAVGTFSLGIVVFSKLGSFGVSSS